MNPANNQLTRCLCSFRAAVRMAGGDPDVVGVRMLSNENGREMTAAEFVDLCARNNIQFVYVPDGYGTDVKIMSKLVGQ